MFQTEAEALAVVVDGQSVEYCEICECYTIIDTDGYPLCMCA